MPRPDVAAHRRAAAVIAFGKVRVERSGERVAAGGAPFNVACHLGALGARPVLVTRVGKDAPGDALVRTLGARGLDLRGVQRDPMRPTGRPGSGHAGDRPLDARPDEACDHIHPGLARMVGLSVHPALVYFDTRLLRGGSRRALRELLDAVDSRVFLDVKPGDPWTDADTLRWSLRQAGVVKLDEGELLRIARLLALDGATPRACAAVLVAAFDLHGLVVTRGAAGAWTLDPAGHVESAGGAALPQVVDPAGAGDGFAAVFMLGMLRRWALGETLARADAFSRALCGTRGAVPDAPDFYAPFIRDW